jgi:hypothetical protein
MALHTPLPLRAERDNALRLFDDLCNARHILPITDDDVTSAM